MEAELVVTALENGHTHVSRSQIPEIAALEKGYFLFHFLFPLHLHLSLDFL
jgi:hypothetical protein